MRWGGGVQEGRGRGRERKSEKRVPAECANLEDSGGLGGRPGRPEDAGPLPGPQGDTVPPLGTQEWPENPFGPAQPPDPRWDLTRRLGEGRRSLEGKACSRKRSSRRTVTGTGQWRFARRRARGGEDTVSLDARHPCESPPACVNAAPLFCSPDSAVSHQPVTGSPSCTWEAGASRG